MKRLFYFLRRIGAAALPILLGALPHGGHAQSYDLIQGVVSPQSWAFARYADKIEPDLYTGTMVFNLPIYTYTDNDFNIPVSLGYASNGLMPNVQTGPLGLGWFLNAGGVISREVVGVPDESRNYQAIGKDLSIGPIGFLDTYEKFTEDILKDTLNIRAWMMDLPGRSRTASWASETGLYELNPDRFHFNFMGYKGTFMLGFDKKIHVFNTNFPEGEIRVEIEASGGASERFIDSFTLTTGDGYVYHFAQIETTSDIHVQNEQRSNWLLSTITAPNGRTVEFKYLELDRFNDRVDAYFPTASSWWFSQVGMVVSSSVNMSAASIHAAYLASITVDDTEILFDYSEKNWEEVDGNAFASLEMNGRPAGMQPPKKMDRIRVRYGSGTSAEERHYVLAYHDDNNIRNDNPVLFLKQVQMPDGGVYSFEYWDRDKSFPLLGSCAIDHWGYYNSTTNLATFIPDVPLTNDLNSTFREKYDEHALIGTRRRPNFTASQMGMLSEIRYPTGGRSNLTYEANTFSQQVSRSNSTDYFPGLTVSDQMNQTAGGVRIRKIVETDNNGGETTREFLYVKETNDGATSSESSGILLKTPRYNTSFTHVNAADGVEYTFNWVTNSELTTFSVDRTHIEYTTVFEHRNDSSYVEHQFTCYEDQPDDRHLFGLPMLGTSTIVDYPRSSIVNNLFSSPFTNHHNRGRLKYKTVRTPDFERIYTEAYNYGPPPDSAVVFTTWESAADQFYQMEIKLQQYRPLSVVRTEYRDGAPWVTTTSYEYNAANQTVLERVTDGQGTTVETHRQFVTDLTGSTGVEARMRSAGVVRYPIHERTKIVTHGFPTPQMIGGTSTGFAEFTGTGAIKFFKPSVARSINLAAPLSSPGNQISTTGLEDEVAYSYDPFGNVTQTRQRGDKYTAYVWGYGGMYLLAKVEGATIATVRTKIPETAPLSGALTDAQEMALRAIPGALVTTYAYQPLVGVTSITDPAGRTVIYEYDAAGRLLRVLDPNGHVVEQYEYHYSSN